MCLQHRTPDLLINNHVLHHKQTFFVKWGGAHPHLTFIPSTNVKNPIKTLTNTIHTSDKLFYSQRFAVFNDKIFISNFQKNLSAIWFEVSTQFWHMVIRYSKFLCWQNLELLHQLVARPVRNLKSPLKTKPQTNFFTCSVSQSLTTKFLFLTFRKICRQFDLRFLHSSGTWWWGTLNFFAGEIWNYWINL